MVCRYCILLDRGDQSPEASGSSRQSRSLRDLGGAAAAVAAGLEGTGLRLLVLRAAELSVATQIELFSRARLLIGSHGAGLANLLYLPSGAGVIELLPAHGINNQLTPGCGLLAECGYTQFWHSAATLQLDYRAVLIHGAAWGTNVSLPRASLTRAVADAVVEQQARVLDSALPAAGGKTDAFLVDGYGRVASAHASAPPDK